MKLTKIEDYWSNVGRTLEERDNEEQVIAGDNDVFYKYKRSRFLQELSTIVEWQDQAILEYGCGPGGNLKFLSQFHPSNLYGVDISSEMLSHAKANTRDLNCPVSLMQNDGKTISLDNKSCDISITSTVLQHNIEDENVIHILRELARISRNKVIVCEHTEKNRKQLHDHFVGRPLSFFASHMEKAGFELKQTQYLNIEVSYFLLGIIRKVFNPKTRKEGESISKISSRMQKLVFPLSRRLDPLWKSNREMTIMVFERVS
ncbi:class I SAM-dependent methyltransferase [Membranihabitans marinus]|uniref:class I SAM-dependent methyltransferase n=1 Tax=Membranihabitans marinus TaxID=1227546 RepID=UPI001F1661B9|nr:class I SAM-dependent methyltransferase [Membranihabitans marinus]